MQNVLVVLVAILLPCAALGESAIETEKELNEITAQLKVEEARLTLRQKQLAIAGTQRDIAKALKEAADSDAEAESRRRLLGVPSIVIDVAWVELVKEPNRFCKAGDFLRYTCHRKVECEFLVDKRLCALPAGDTEAMVLKGRFACGTGLRDVFVPVGQTAYLTCK